MFFKKLRRVIGAVALTGMLAAAPVLFSGCNTDHPEAKITISFNGTDYVLEYKMYRNMYPQTVQHFIELADNGFYNNTIIHDYSSSYLRGGAFNYVENETLSYANAYDAGEEGLREYLANDAVNKEPEYNNLADPLKGKITPSVYRNFINGSYSDPLNTLIGEFSNNQHKIDPSTSALKSSYGCLRMFYSSKSDDLIKQELANGRVYLNKTGSAAGVQGEYKYNSATSLFSVQLTTSTSSDSSYCIFAVLQNTDVLKSLATAINTTSYNVTAVNLNIDNYDSIIGPNANSTSYSVSKTPIIVKSVKITKY